MPWRGRSARGFDALALCSQANDKFERQDDIFSKVKSHRRSEAAISSDLLREFPLGRRPSQYLARGVEGLDGPAIGVNLAFRRARADIASVERAAGYIRLTRIGHDASPAPEAPHHQIRHPQVELDGAARHVADLEFRRARAPFEARAHGEGLLRKADGREGREDEQKRSTHGWPLTACRTFHRTIASWRLREGAPHR
jgi:hypothetical protein